MDSGAVSPSPPTRLARLLRLGHALLGSATFVSFLMAVLGGVEALLRVPAESPDHRTLLAYGAYLAGFGALPLCLIASGLVRLLKLDKRSGSWLPSFLAGLLFSVLVFSVAILQTHPAQLLGTTLSGLNPFLPGLAVSLVAALLFDRWLAGRTSPLSRLPRLRTIALAAVVPLGAAWMVLSTIYEQRDSANTVYEETDDLVDPPVARSGDQPDIVWIVVDTLRADAVSLGNSDSGWTPSLAALASNSIVYTQAVSTASWTGTSFASMYSATGAAVHGCLDVQDSLTSDATTIAEVLRAGGYRTVAIHNNANVSHQLGFGQGFHRFVEAATSGRFPPQEAKTLALQRALNNPRINTLAAGKWSKQHYAPADVVLATARQELALAAEDPRPLFLVVHLMEPHSPYFRHPEDGTGLQPDPERSNRDELWSRYLGEVWWMDSQLGDFFADLQRASAWDHTVVVVSGDHGEEFHEHGGWWHGRTLYEEVTRVPLLLKPPSREAAGTRVATRVTTLDIAPTLAAVAGLDRPEQWQGLPLPPFGPGTLHPQANQAFRGQQQRAVWDGDWKLLQHPEEPPALFNLSTDPAELDNRVPTHADDTARLTALLPTGLTPGEAGPQEALDCATCEDLRALGYMDSCLGCRP